jgi:nitroimidazol reductase NimA-like FMN-containing flavoprotein (pyridoxamine 5'-phosphate oxidase superfamily)
MVSALGANWASALHGEACFNGAMDTLTAEQCQTLLEEAHVGHIGVVTDEGPYVTPISYVVIGNQIAFRTAPGRRTEAIQVDPRVSIEVSRYDRETGDWSSVIVTGTARVIRNDPGKEQIVVDALFEKYRNAYDNLLSLPAGLGPGTRFIVVVDVAEVSGRSSGGYLQPRTRPGRL